MRYFLNQDPIGKHFGIDNPKYSGVFEILALRISPIEAVIQRLNQSTVSDVAGISPDSAGISPNPAERVRPDAPKPIPAEISRREARPVSEFQPVFRPKAQCLANAFRAGYRTEPDNITLEALLYRALAVELNFISLGGLRVTVQRE